SKYNHTGRLLFIVLITGPQYGQRQPINQTAAPRDPIILGILGTLVHFRHSVLGSFLFICGSGYCWISAKDSLQMLANCGLTAYIPKKVLKNNDFC
ncbi:MAG: hypothetical protein QNL14_06490, partial [Deltaproteobacteria bacterium]|nr:hypothetical protein [Deltaproteobacteria bacterium]